MFDDLVSYVEEQEEKIKSSEKEILLNDVKLAKTKNQIANAESAHAKLASMNMEKDLKNGINIYKKASEKSGFKNLFYNIKKVEKAFNTHQL